MNVRATVMTQEKSNYRFYDYHSTLWIPYYSITIRGYNELKLTIYKNRMRYLWRYTLSQTKLKVHIGQGNWTIKRNKLLSLSVYKKKKKKYLLNAVQSRLHRWISWSYIYKIKLPCYPISHPLNNRYLPKQILLFLLQPA